MNSQLVLANLVFFYLLTFLLLIAYYMIYVLLTAMF